MSKVPNKNDGCNCAELEQARREVEQLRVQLAGCLTAAEGATGKYGGLLPYQGDYGWSLAYQRVLELRMKYDKATHAAQAAQTL